jgi:simple sugar transport system permease protein
MGMRGYVTGDLSPGFGYTGVIVAMLAQLHPLGVPVAAVLVASVFVGADAMSRMFNVPSFIADVMVSLSLLSMLAGSFFLSYRVRK